MQEITYLDHEQRLIKIGTVYKWQDKDSRFLRGVLSRLKSWLVKAGVLIPEDKTMVRYYHNVLDTSKLEACGEVRRQIHYLRRQGVKPRRIIVGYKQQEQILRESMDNHYTINFDENLRYYGVTLEVHPLIDGIVVSGEE